MYRLPAVVLLAVLHASVAVAEPEQAVDEPLSLAVALKTALEKSPSLAAYSWDLRAADARIVQAGLRPNPVLSLEVEDVQWRNGAKTRTRSYGIGLPPEVELGTEAEDGAAFGFEESEVTLGLSQIVELGGKRAKRVRLARQDAIVARWDYEAARANVLADVARAFAAALTTQEQLDLYIEQFEFSEQVRATTERRTAAGQISPIELHKANVQLTIARAQRERAAVEYEGAKHRLAGLMGLSEAPFNRLAGSLELPRQLPPLDELLDRAVQNPDVARWVDELSRREAAYTLERSLRLPDVELTVGLRATGQHSGRIRGATLTSGGASVFESRIEPGRDWDTSAVFQVSLPLPVFNRNQGGVKEAEHLLKKAADERRAAELSVAAGLAEWYRRAEAAALQLKVLEEEALPEAGEAFELTQEGFRQGKFGYLDVLDAERTLFDLHAQMLEARRAYYEGLVEIERLIGSLYENAGGHASESGDTE